MNTIVGFTILGIIIFGLEFLNHIFDQIEQDSKNKDSIN